MLHANTQSTEQLSFSVKGKGGIYDLGLGNLSMTISQKSQEEQ